MVSEAVGRPWKPGPYQDARPDPADWQVGMIVYCRTGGTTGMDPASGTGPAERARRTAMRGTLRAIVSGLHVGDRSRVWPLPGLQGEALGLALQAASCADAQVGQAQGHQPETAARPGQRRGDAAESETRALQGISHGVGSFLVCLSAFSLPQTVQRQPSGTFS